MLSILSPENEEGFKMGDLTGNVYFWWPSENLSYISSIDGGSENNNKKQTKKQDILCTDHYKWTMQSPFIKEMGNN
jgi:hypothetical protein